MDKAETRIAIILSVGGAILGSVVGAVTSAALAEKSTVPDRIAIEDMVTRYYENFGSTDAAEQFGRYYTEDAVFDVNGVVSTGRKEIEALYTSMGEQGDAPATQGTFHMIISNPVIDVDGRQATARFMWTGVMNREVGARPELYEQGREYDLLVKQDGEWRIKKRVVIADSGLPERFKATYEPRMDYDITK